MLEIKKIKYPLVFINENNDTVSKNKKSLSHSLNEYDKGFYFDFIVNSKKFDKFNISFVVDLTQNKSKIGLSCIVDFEININNLLEKEKDESKISILIDKLQNINAPAMAFPFIRAYICDLLVKSGYEPYYIKSIDFIERYNRDIDKIINEKKKMIKNQNKSKDSKQTKATK